MALAVLQVGPGGAFGGMEFGSATDGQRLYVNNNNYERVNTTLVKPVPGTAKWTEGGFVAALDAYSGTILWSFANSIKEVIKQPRGVDYATWRDPNGRYPWSVNAATEAPLTVANGVLFLPSMDPAGHLFFLDAKTGKRVGDIKLGASSNCGPSVVDGIVYTGSGYEHLGDGTSGQWFYALTIPEVAAKLRA